jgi:biotin carboxylase
MADLFWIIGGGLLQVPLVKEVRALGYSPLVSDGDALCVCAPLADRFLAIDIFDIEGHLREADRLQAGGDHIAAVLAAGIDAPETMAALNDHLGLKGVDRRLAHVVNHKDQFRALTAQHRLEGPRFRAIGRDDLERLSGLAAEVGFPLIVKNSDSSGSRGTRILRDPDVDTLRAAVETAMEVSRSGRAVLEQLWEGPEQTVETLFDVQGNFHRCFITDRIFDRSEGYALEVGLRHPTSLPAKDQEALYRMAETVACTLEVRVGAAKFDTMLTADGPRVIEMTVRLSGGFDCQYLVPAATGKNVLRAAALTALGQLFDPALLVDTKHRVALSGSIWPEPGRIVDIRGVDDARGIPGVELVVFRYDVGDVVEPYVDCTKRVCFVIVSGNDESEAQATLDAARAAITIETAPVVLA